MSYATIETALKTLAGSLTGISQVYDGMPESPPVSMCPIAWVEVVHLGDERQTGGPRANAAIAKYYRATIYFLLGEEDMIESLARPAAQPWPALVETAIADETLGGVVWDVQMDQRQCGNNLDKYEGLAGVYPLSWVVLNIIDY